MIGFEKGRIIESNNNEEYVTMSVININNKKYAFANKFNDKEQSINEYVIFTMIDNEITILEDNNLINKLLPIFQKEIEKDLRNILNNK